MLFSIVAAPFYIPDNTAQEFQVLRSSDFHFSLSPLGITGCHPH